MTSVVFFLKEPEGKSLGILVFKPRRKGERDFFGVFFWCYFGFKPRKKKVELGFKLWVIAQGIESSGGLGHSSCCFS